MSQKQEQHKRGEWSSSLGFILAAAGSAVGLGIFGSFRAGHTTAVGEHF